MTVAIGCSVVALALYARACWRKIRKLDVRVRTPYDFLGSVPPRWR